MLALLLTDMSKLTSLPYYETLEHLKYWFCWTSQKTKRINLFLRFPK